MPASKLTLSRFRILDSCFTSRLKKYWSIEELLEKLEEHDISISRRTLESDFENLRYDERLGYLAPIEYCKRNKGFYYADQSYKMTNVALTAEDFDTLYVVREFVKAFENIPLVNRFRNLMNRLATSGNGSVDDKPCIKGEPAFNDHGASVTEALFNAVRIGNVVNVFLIAEEGGKRHSFFFHPYYLHRANFSTFFVVGLIEGETGYTQIDVTTIDSVLDTTMALIPFDANLDKKHWG
jgi:hypothetical protein